MKKDENKIILKQWIQVFIILLILVMMAFGLWAVIKSVSHDESQGKELYKYNYTSNMDYKVYLKQNEFYTSPYMGMNKQYIASLIDHIDVNMKYNLISTEELDYNYTTELVATARGIYSESDGNGNEIWSKSYPLAQNDNKSFSGKNIDISKTVAIDYNQYNKIMNDFRTKFGLSVDARVDVALKINVTGSLRGTDKNTLEESNTMTLQIPLLKPTVQLKPDYVNSGTKTVYAKNNDTNGVNVPLLLAGIILLVIGAFMFRKYAIKLLNITKKSEYIIRLNKIFKEYGDVVAETGNLPDLSKYDVVSIKHFNDLVDIEEELHSPIISTEIREDLETWFMIFYNNTAYRYILKYEDFGKIINRNY